jgi:hypothetical protein
MTYRNGWLLACCAALMAVFSSTPAHAQFAVFVSGNGSNANDCSSPATACRSLGHAEATVQPGGVIHVLPGEYSLVFITKSVEIIADGGQASISSANAGSGGVSAPIIVSAGPADVVRIRGFTIGRPGAVNGGGIGLVAGGALHLEDCTLVGSNGDYGINFQPSTDSVLSVTNCTIANNGASTGGGILVSPQPGGSARVSIDNSRILNNRRGLHVTSGGVVMVRNSIIAHNESAGIRVSGTGVVGIADSTISGNATGLSAVDGGQIISHKGNALFDNATNGAFTSTVNPL